MVELIQEQRHCLKLFVRTTSTQRKVLLQSITKALSQKSSVHSSPWKRDSTSSPKMSVYRPPGKRDTIPSPKPTKKKKD